MKIKVFMKTWTLTCKTRVKVTLLMKTWNDPTVITNILPQAVSRKTPIEDQFLTEVWNVFFLAKQWIWKTWKKELGGINRPPDCISTSVSLLEYFSFHVQQKRWQDCIEINQKSLKHIKIRKIVKSVWKNSYLELGGRGGSL